MRGLYLILLLLVTFSCDIDSQEKMSLTALADRTDPHILSPKAEDIKTLIDLEHTPNMAVDIAFQNLGNVDYSPVTRVSIPAYSILDNGLQRTSNIKRFYAKIDSLVLRENIKDYDFHNSSILHPLIDHLNKLNHSGANKKQLLLYSDLMEFSDVFNSYDSRGKLLNDPISVGKELRETLEVPDLQGVRLFLMYYPKTNEHNRLFRAWCEVYRELFKESGLTIEIGGNQISTHDYGN